MKQEGNILTASDGMELYKISDPETYSKKIALGVNDSILNWGERPETNHDEAPEFVFKSSRTTTRKQSGSKKNWIQIIIEKIKKLIKSIK